MSFERAFALLLALLSLFLLYLAWGYQAPISYDPLGPRPYPLLILSLLAGGSLWLALGRREISKLGYSPALLGKLTICFLMLLAYGLTFELLGFPLATALMALVVGRLFGGSWGRSALAGLALGLGFYLLFDRLLDVPLPLGRIFN